MTTNEKGAHHTPPVQPMRPIANGHISDFNAPTHALPNVLLVSGLGQYHSNEANAKVKRSYMPVMMSIIETMLENPPSSDKTKAQWAIFSTLESRTFAEQLEKGEFWALWADFDEQPKPLAAIEAVWREIAPNTLAWFYSSRSATADNPKSRMIIPLAEPLDGAAFVMAQACLNDAFEDRGFIADRAAERPAQLCYLPNRGEFYDWRKTGGDLCDTATLEAALDSYRQQRIEAERKRQADIKAKQQRKTAPKRADGHLSPIEWFNATHSVHDILLAAGYEGHPAKGNAKGDDYRHPNSKSGSYSAIVYRDTGRVSTQSPDDPLYTEQGNSHDAFSAWCVLNHGGDEQAALRDINRMRDAPTSCAGDAEAAVTADTDGRALEQAFPAADDRPCFFVASQWITQNGRRYRPGVYWCTTDDKDDGNKLVQRFVCGEMHIDAMTFDEQDNNHGLLLRIHNRRGSVRQWACPMELLAGSGEELRRELLNMGLKIFSENQKYLTRYLMTASPNEQVACAVKTGWHGDAFVLPNQVIGGTDKVIFQSPELIQDDFKQKGTLQGWQENIASKAIGNPSLTLAISAAFAGALLKLCHMEGGGIHLYGESSTGKSTALEAAASVWGGDSYKRSWRTTSNGLEGAASVFNDGLLCLDEISECDPKQVGEIVYLLGNGQGKQRASRAGGAKSIKTWRCMIVSTGERTVETSMAEGGYRSKAGQQVRMLDVPVIGKHGLFDELHGFDSGAALSDHIKTQRHQHHGHAGIEFLTKLTADQPNLSEELEGLKKTPAFKHDGGGQLDRAVARFALIALAGELATEYGITGWQKGTAIDAVAVVFRRWIGEKDTDSSERVQVVRVLTDFLDKHGDSRFSELSNHDDDTPIRDRAGYWRYQYDKETKDEQKIYLLNASAMNEATRGFDLRRVLDILEEKSIIPPAGADGKRQRVFRVGKHTKRLYEVNYARLLGGD